MLRTVRQNIDRRYRIVRLLSTVSRFFRDGKENPKTGRYRIPRRFETPDFGSASTGIFSSPVDRPLFTRTLRPMTSRWFSVNLTVPQTPKAGPPSLPPLPKFRSLFFFFHRPGESGISVDPTEDYLFFFFQQIELLG